MGLLSAINRLPLWQRRVRVGGSQFRATSFDRLVYLVLQRLNWMGEDERAFFAKHVKPGMRIAEAGANLGVFTLFLSQLVGADGKIFAFEPDPTLHSALLDCLASNSVKNVTAIPRALGSKPAQLAIKTFGLNSGDNRLCENTSESGAIPVEVVRMDEALAGERIDFVKLDVQGWEVEALRGMTRIFEANPSISLLVEFWPFGLRRAGSEPLDLIAFLQNAGFQLSTTDGKPFTREEASRWDDGSKKFTNIHATRS